MKLTSQALLAGLTAATSVFNVAANICANATFLSDGDSCVHVADPSNGDVTFVGSTVTNDDGNKVDTFLGVQYATQERFARSELLLNPQEAPGYNPTTGVLLAKEFGPACQQPTFPGLPPVSSLQSEDCLYANIYTPSGRSKEDALPVMVWIHGGSLYSGEGAQYAPFLLAGNEDVVVVTLNYRLAFLGFLPTGPDNEGALNGMLDVVQALEWVQKRISYFGGDPEMVTIFGESAGAYLVTLLSVRPEGEGLFLRAISESTYYQSLTKTPVLNETLPGLDDLMAMSGEAVANLTYFGTPPNTFVLGNVYLPTNPLDLFQEGPINPTDMIIGSNTYDAPSMSILSKEDLMDLSQVLFLFNPPALPSFTEEEENAIRSLYPLDSYNNSVVEANIQTNADTFYTCFAREMAQLASKTIDGNVFSYWYGHFSPSTDLLYNGLAEDVKAEITDPNFAFHGAETFLLFGNNLDNEDKSMSTELVARWAGFARSGNPQLSSSTTWDPVSPLLANNFDVPYLYMNSEGVTMVKSDKQKIKQCTEVIPQGIESISPEGWYFSSDADSDHTNDNGDQNGDSEKNKDAGGSATGVLSAATALTGFALLINLLV